MLLSSGASIQACDEGGLHPLHNACSFGHADVVRLLLEAGASPNTTDNWNYTPLHEAAQKGKIDVCIGMYTRIYMHCFALHSFANDTFKRIYLVVSCNTIVNFSYLLFEFSHSHIYVNICIALLQHGANPNIRNSEQKTPLDLADENTRPVLTGEYCKDELLEAARSGAEDRLLALLTPLNVNCHASDGRRSTLLHLAAGYNRINIVRVIAS